MDKKFLSTAEMAEKCLIRKTKASICNKGDYYEITSLLDSDQGNAAGKNTSNDGWFG